MDIIMADNKYTISEIASLYSRVQWVKMQPLPDGKIVGYRLFIPNQPEGIRLDVRVLREEVPEQSGFVVAINNKFAEEIVPHYLGFELMGIAGSVALLYDAEIKNYRKRLTKQSLNGYKIEVPDIETQFIYADSFYFVERLKTYLSKKDDDRYNQLRLSLFQEVMDALSLEQVMGTFFTEMDIHIYDPWKNLLNRFDRNDKQYMNKLFGELISKDNEVMNGVRKVRIAVKNISELYKK